MAQIRELLRTQPIVRDVFYQENLTQTLSSNLTKLGYVMLGLSIFFILVAIALIHNTIKLALYANRFTIKNMELVGASWEFISRPYLRKAIYQGFLSASFAIIGLTILNLWAAQQLPELKSIQDWTSISLLFATLIVLGILINTLSTYIVVKKYLKLRLDDLY